VHALDARTGRKLWQFAAGGRVDSPPTVLGSLVIFGSTDGWVYCLQAETGELAWRFQAARHDRFVSVHGQLESAWPVHGSVLVGVDRTSTPFEQVVYFCAGRSSFLDGGMDLYGLDPCSGEIVHHTRLAEGDPDPFKDVGMSGYMDGAKSDILVSDGTDIFLYQMRFRSDLESIETPLQDFGAQGGGQRLFSPAPERGSSGRHLIATGGLLDGSFNEGTFWTYSERWPGWDRRMSQVPNYGQLMTFDETTSVAINYYTLRNRVRNGFFPGDKGYRVFSRDHDGEVDVWSAFKPVRVEAMVLTEDKLFLAGPPDVVPDEDPVAAFEGRLGAVLLVVDRETGEDLAVYELDSPPVFDGMIAAPNRLYLSTATGRVMCFGGTVSD
jgi:hypothetical protein